MVQFFQHLLDDAIGARLVMRKFVLKFGEITPVVFGDDVRMMKADYLVVLGVYENGWALDML